MFLFFTIKILYMKLKILNILPHEPDYRFKENDPKPKINWDTPDGQWVGIYRNEIPNKLGREVLQLSDEFEYEVWQPDYRADKMYSHTFEDGMVHRLFPASDVTVYHGLKKIKRIHSPALVDYLQSYARENELVVNLNGDFCPLNYDVLERCGDLPILQTFRGTMNLPKSMVFKKRKNILASLSYFQQHLKAKKLIQNIDCVTYQNSLNMDYLEQIYQGPRAKVTSGCDFGFWKKLNKEKCRSELGLPQNKTIFLTSSLLIMRKQIDKLIEVCKELDPHYDFLLLISGHGTPQYEKYLYDLAKPLIDKGKVKFTGYITGATLRKYYSSSDLFLNTANSEGGPVSAMKAIACETPVFSTTVGNVPERMQKNKSGILVGTHDYGQWKKELEDVLQGKEVKLFNREEGEEKYDWQKIAAKFRELYRYLGNKHYNKKKPHKQAGKEKKLQIAFPLKTA